MSYVSPKWNNGSDPPLSAENLQALTDAVQEQGEALETMCNPNLLDNWYFGKPVNQKGQTSYGPKPNGGYTIDRWMSTEEVSVNSAGFVTSKTLVQRIESAELLSGKILTFSALTASGELLTGSKALDIPADCVFADVGGRVMQYSAYWKGFQIYRDAAALDLLAVKLELGSQQTLAHQENGKWVLNEIPKFGDQLAECQRYLIPINNWTRVRASYYSGTALFFAVPIPSTMRTTPAILDPSGALAVQSVSGTEQTGFTFECNASTPGSISVRAMKDSHGLTDGQLVKRGGGSFQAVFFSSEL